MTLRIARLVLDPIPEGTVGFSDPIADARATSRASRTTSFSQFRQKFQSDETLAGNLQCGDADALTVLFERHGPRLLGVAHRILRNDADAEDAVQQIFLDVFRSIQQFDPDKGTFKNWLFMFGYQRIFNRRRSLSADRFFHSDPFDELLPGLPCEPARAFSYSLPEVALLVQQVLDSLQPRQRRTIELVYYEGLTAEEISVRTGETVRVVRHNLYRGLERLRKALGPRIPSGETSGKGGK